MNFSNFTRRSKTFIDQSQKLAISNEHQQVLPEHLLGVFLDNHLKKNFSLLKNINFDENMLHKYLNDKFKKIPKVFGDDLKIIFSDDFLRILQKSSKDIHIFGDKFISPEVLFYSLLTFDDKEINLILANSGITIEKIENGIKLLRKNSTINTQTMDEKDKVLDSYTIDITKLAKEGKLDPVIGREEEIRRSIQVLSRRTKNNPVLIGEPGVGKTAIVEGLAQRIINQDVPELLKKKKLLSLDLGALVAGAKFRGEFEERLKSILSFVEKEQENLIIFIDEIHTLVGAGKAEGSMDASNLLKPALARGELHCIGATTLTEYRESIEKDAALARRFQQVLVSEPSLEDSISILRGLKEKYEVHHGVRIHDSAIISAVELSKRYINDRFLPDKAIDLMDEAASRIRIQVDSKPEGLDKIERKIMQNKIELESLKKDSDKKSLERKKEIKILIEDLEKDFSNLNKQWEKEKNKINDIQKVKSDIENYKSKLSLLQRDGKLSEAGELAYGKIPVLEKQLDTMEKNFSEKEMFQLLNESVSSDDIAHIVSKWTGIPIERMVENDKNRILSIESELQKKIVGQNNAIEQISKAVKRASAGIQDPNKPIGVFMFLGPTGVGKTELTKSLSEFLFANKGAMLRIDMSEYMEKHSVSKLIGAPPGYIGHENAGLLTEAIRRKPYQIILLDEIEKAHDDIFNLLLQVFDDGRLTDSQGRTVNFKNTIIILTSNLGADLMTMDAEQEKINVYTKEKILEIVRNHFKPEFLNRIDEILIFERLTKKHIEQIIDIQLNELFLQLKDKKINVKIDDTVKKWLVGEGFAPEYGARPLKRVIQKNIKDKIAEKILSQNIKDDEEITISTNEEGIVIK